MTYQNSRYNLVQKRKQENLERQGMPLFKIESTFNATSPSQAVYGK